MRITTRTGVNTGEVVVGGADSATDQRLATGDAVNIAARLEQAAAPGEVLLGADTYNVVGENVVAEAVAPVDAKGKSEPLAAWRLIAVRPDVPAFARPIANAVRRPERGARTFSAPRSRRPSEARSCELATIIGTPGIGKSRLVREFVGSLETRARILVGRCVAYGDGISYLPLGEVVRELAGEDPEPELAELLSEVERGEVAARLVSGAVGGDSAAGSPEETAWAFRRLFETIASARPLVLVVDDIHWAEPTMLDLLEYVVGASSTAPILIVCLARPDLLETRPSWAAQQHAGLVTLKALDDAASQSLVDELLREHDLPPELPRTGARFGRGQPAVRGADARDAGRRSRRRGQRQSPRRSPRSSRRASTASSPPSAPSSSVLRSRADCSIAASVAELVATGRRVRSRIDPARPRAEGVRPP